MKKVMSAMMAMAMACTAEAPAETSTDQKICTIDDPDCGPPGTMFDPGWDLQAAADTAQQPASAARTNGCVTYRIGSYYEAQCYYSFPYNIAVECHTVYTSDENGIRIEYGYCYVY